jgi:hypothetical protein
MQQNACLNCASYRRDGRFSPVAFGKHHYSQWGATLVGSRSCEVSGSSR